MEINVEVDKRFAGCIKLNWLKDIVMKTLGSQGIGSEAEVSLVVTGQKHIHELNKTYLDEDRPTDVLSFPMAGDSSEVGFVIAPDGKKHLGEVLVSSPQAVLQAEEHGHSVEREIAVLIVHGLLHLLGYDHAAAAGKKVMWDRQKEIIRSLGEAAA